MTEPLYGIWNDECNRWSYLTPPPPKIEQFVHLVHQVMNIDERNGWVYFGPKHLVEEWFSDRRLGSSGFSIKSVGTKKDIEEIKAKAEDQRRRLEHAMKYL